MRRCSSRNAANNYRMSHWPGGGALTLERLFKQMTLTMAHRDLALYAFINSQQRRMHAAGVSAPYFIDIGSFRELMLQRVTGRLHVHLAILKSGDWSNRRCGAFEVQFVFARITIGLD